MRAFTLKQLREIKTVVVHGPNCPDGIMSALIVADAIPKASFHFIAHSTRAHEEIEITPGMLYVDFSPHKSKVKEHLAAKTLVLDHHAKGSTCLEFVREGLGAFGDEKLHPGVCGASLAYTHVWEPIKGGGRQQPGCLHYEVLVREFARLSGIRDTWQRQDPDWDIACKQALGLQFWPRDQLLRASPDTWLEKVAIGDILWERQLKTAKKIADKAFRWVSPKGTRIVFFQGSRLTSDIAEYLSDTADLIIGYDIQYDDEALKMLFSLRSHTGYDCGSFAKKHGGGGHTPAAGFGQPLDLETSPNPYKFMQQVVGQYEE